MKTFLSLCCLLLAVSSLAVAAETGKDHVGGPATRDEALEGRVEAILEAQRTHGYSSPRAAITQLLAAGARPGDAAPLALRRRYHAALAAHAVLAQQAPLFRRSVDTLDAMARREACRPCHDDALLNRAQWAISENRMDEAARLVDEASRGIAATDLDGQLQLHFARARLNDLRGMFTRGIAESVVALDLAERSGNVADQVRVMRLMIGMNADLGDYARAEALAREAYAIAERNGFGYMMGHIRLHQGYLFALAERPEEQLHALRDALRIADGDPGRSDIAAISLANLSDYFLQRGKPREALDYAWRAERLARALDDQNGRAVALANAGIALSQLGDNVGGIARLTEAIELARRFDASSYVLAMTEELVAAYERAGRDRDAVAAMRKVVSLNKDITRQEREKAVLELQEKYSAERRSREIERLSAANRLKEAEVAARTWQQRLWTAVALLLAIAALPVLRRLRRMLRDNRKLSGDIAVLTEQSAHDPLTGAFNRRHCQTIMGQHEAQLLKADGRDYHAGVGLMVLDVDFFKRVNDTYGHAAGDRVLVEIARRLRTLVRQQDAVVRWGGEEFVLVLPGTTAPALEPLAERVLQAIGSTPIDIGTQEIHVRVSIGCAAFPLAPELRWQDALHVADLALYLSKAGGRNRATCVAAVTPGADADRLRSDLAAAAAAGDVELRTVAGPAMQALIAAA